MNEPKLNQLYGETNLRYFEGTLPPCRIIWSRQLTRAAGNIDVRKRLIKLSQPLLIDAFDHATWPHEYEICGVSCSDSHSALREILKHEMIHLWLHERGLPSGHTAQFRAKAQEIGQPKTRHAIARPLPRNGWIYRCAHCDQSLVRRRRFGRAVACSPCCKRWSGGNYDERFKLRGARISGA